MIKKTIEKIEASIQKISTSDNQKKDELIKLLSSLKIEIEELYKTHNEHAQSIAGFTEIASHETTRKDKESHLINLSLEGLSSSVKGFEASNPKLVKIVNDLCSLLSSIGI
ncbi:MAG: hypothetical protein HYT97_04030 [Elusimicrobia bacterium]|nr:hypothetical protein [Elusimicrobiota bacterium]